MSVKPIPDGYHTITPYLIVPEADAFISFMREAFGARERMRFDNPDGRIMHAEVEIGDSVLMLGEATDEFQARPANIHLYVEDCDAVYRRALAAGGESLREPSDQPYGDRSAAVADRWGNNWWLATHIEDVSQEEVERRMKAGTAS